MRKFLLPFALLAVGFTSVAAPGDILCEDFEGMPAQLSPAYAELVFSGDWKVVNQHADADLPKRWCLARDTDKDVKEIQNRKAWIDQTTYGDDGFTPEAGVSLLMTPVIDVTEQYEIAFQWASSGMALDKKQYDLRAYVIEEGKDFDENDFVFSILDPDMVLESGIQPTKYDWYEVAWVGWNKYVSKIDLTPWKGKKVRVAFGYVITGVTSSYSGKIDSLNSIELDDIRVYAKEQATEPEATLSTSAWNFGQVYVGAKVRSDILTLTNTGTAGLQVTGIEAPAGFSVVFDRAQEDINLKKNESLQLQVVYEASLTSAASGNVVIKTNGKDGVIAVSATKQMLAEGEVFEGFEGDAFPPAGWTVKSWGVASAQMEGDKAATPTAYYQEANYLRSPRIDASKSAAKISFTYADFYNGEEAGADTEVLLQFSSDGGSTWKTVDMFDYQDTYNTIINKTYTESASSDNCYWQFVWNLTYYDSETGAEASLFYLDAVVLNNLYGAGSVPSATTAVSPAQGASDVYFRGVTLQWNPAQFATGYKLYVGTDANATDLVNGVDLGDKLSYDLPSLAYSTVYNWKVVPYNAKGDATGVATWQFTTIADPTITTLPYYEGFDAAVPPSGWNMVASGTTRWSKNEISPYGGKASAMANPRYDGNVTSLETPEIVVSEDAFASFYWGDGVAVGLLKDDSGQVVNTTKGYDGISKVTFEIFVDGEWHELAMLSDKSNSYWIRERFDLAPYVGKTISLRWVYTYDDYMKASGACIDEFAIEPAAAVKLSFNTTGYDAGKVNHDESFSTENTFTLYNDGSQDAEIKSVTFKSGVFGSSLKAGDKIAAGKAINFALTVNGNDANAAIEDEMVLTTADGSVATLPVKAEVLPSDIRFYGFERDPYGSLNPRELTTVDVDRRSSVSLMMVDYAHRGEAFAFVVMNYKKADWSICYPNTGDQCLVTFGADADGLTVEDWIISPAMTATDQSSFDFYCRDYLNADDTRFGQGRATVLVSTEGVSDLSKFEQVSTNLVPRPTGEEYYKFSTDLKKYAGKKIWVALRHTVTDGLAYFYDDLCYNHFDSFESGQLNVVSTKADISLSYDAVAGTVTVNGVEAADLTVTSMAGQTVAVASGVNTIDVSALAPGVYAVTVKSENGVASERFIKR
ncbi:MAG: choice-of-anchor J domain-containing protein [Muribaculaceae bacterium]|nr:choice-of-anchor J domain-containing protein [Muribaculaceae bacterium]